MLINGFRPALVIYNRYDHVDPDLGVVSEPDQLPEDPYPFQPVIEEGATNVDGTIKGSCSNFKVFSFANNDFCSYRFDPQLFVFLGEERRY